MPDISLEYKSRLANLKLLPFMYFYELQDILFFTRPWRQLKHLLICSFSNSFRSSRTNKLSHKLCHITAYRHLYFSRLVRLWSTLLAGTIDLFLSYTSIKKNPLKDSFGIILYKILTHTILVLFMLWVHVQTVLITLRLEGCVGVSFLYRGVQKSHLLKSQTKYTVQLHLSGSSVHVAYLYLTRVICYKLHWNCDILLEPTDFLKFGL